jgi:hypothetical protein
MEDPTTPSSRDPPTAPSSPVAPNARVVPFASFERASAHVQGRYHDAYAYAKRFGETPHAFTGGLPVAFARSSEVVNAALRSLRAKTQSAEQERDAWREKCENAQRELRKAAAERDEAVRRSEEARRHREENGARLCLSPNSPPRSPEPTTVQARVRRIEGAENPNAGPNDASRETRRDEAAFVEPRNEARDVPSTRGNPPPDRPKLPDSDALGFTRSDLDALTRRAEAAEAALRASEAANALVTRNAWTSDVGALKTRLAAAEAEHAARIRELNASWSSRVRAAEEKAERIAAELVRGRSASRDTDGDYETVIERRGKKIASPDPREKRVRVRGQSGAAASTSSAAAAARDGRREAKKKKSTKTTRGKQTIETRRVSRSRVATTRNHASRGVLEHRLRNIPDTDSEAGSVSRADSESDSESDADAETFRRQTRGDFSVEHDPSVSGKPRTSHRDAARRPWGSGFATSNVTGAFGVSPRKATGGSKDAAFYSRNAIQTRRRHPPAAAPPVTYSARQPLVSVSGVPDAIRRPPFRGTAKYPVRIALPISVSRAAGGFQYASSLPAYSQRNRGGGFPSVASSRARDRSLSALKLARAAARRRGATIAAARRGEITETPAVSLGASPIASPRRTPTRRDEKSRDEHPKITKPGIELDDDVTLDALRASFEATREEYSKIARDLTEGGVEYSGEALDAVMARLQDVSEAIAKRLRLVRSG